jgi:hypothetical protein
LIALTKSVDLGGVLSGVILFLGFFFGTTLYLVPLALGGLLTVIGKVKLAARYISLVIAIWFIWQGGANIYKGYQEKQKRILDPLENSYQPVIIMPAADSLYAKALADSLAKYYQPKAKIRFSESPAASELSSYTDQDVIYINARLWNDSWESTLLKQNYVILPQDYNISTATNFLSQSSFKVSKGKGFHWSFVVK